MFREFIVPNDNETDDEPAFCHECQETLKNDSVAHVDLEHGVTLCGVCFGIQLGDD